MTQPQPGERLLDACCGTGSLSLLLQSKRNGEGELVGIDISPYMLRRARSKVKGANFILANAEEIPFPDCYFDKATLTLALHEMPPEKRRRVLRELKRVIREGGRLVLGELRPSEVLWGRILFYLVEVPSWIKEMAHLKEEITACGLKPIINEDLGEIFQILVAEK